MIKDMFANRLLELLRRSPLAASKQGFPRLLVGALLAGFLTGCAAPTSPPDRGPSAMERAEQALASGREEDAALALVDAAAELRPAEAQRTRLDAAWLLARVGNEADALMLLEQSTVDGDSDLVAQRMQVAVLAELSVAGGDPVAAINMVDAIDLAAINIDPDAAQENLPATIPLLATRARAHETLEQDLPAALDLAELLLLDQRVSVFEQRRQTLWALLDRQPGKVLGDWSLDRDAALGVWLELALLVKAQRFDPTGLPSRLDDWAARQPAAFSRGGWLTALGEHQLKRRDHPSNIAALLPLSGDHGQAGQAVRDGLLAAWYALPAPRPELRFHDIGSDNTQVRDSFQQAVDQGAEFIVGPLTREQVAVIAALRDIATPTLALNASPDGFAPPSLLYQFGLLPEHDADTAARHALSGGLYRVAILVPDGSWGQRVAAAFKARFDAESRQIDSTDAQSGIPDVVATVRYDEQARDHSTTLRSLFLLQDSDTRRRRLQGHLNVALAHETRRRQDVDAVFLAATPAQARLLQPQIRFHQGSGLPLLATSQIFDGDTHNRDTDLRDIIFFTRPTALAEPSIDIRHGRFRQLVGEPPVVSQPHESLFYLGVDALRLIPRLPQMRIDDEMQLDGATGKLTLTPQGVVRRSMPAARFTSTGVTALD